MGKIVLYVLQSLDGYIARKNGDVDWLYTEGDYGYGEFIGQVGFTIMGHKTYEQILSFDCDFPYQEQKNYVFTRNSNREKAEHVEFISGDVIEFTKRLKQESDKNIWVIGGGEINALMLNSGLVDEINLFIQPTLIGEGLPLFFNIQETKNFELQESRTFETGVVMMKLRLRKSEE